jgi:NAD(P)-dependent dehydrogenase (short-subunit alcohol dehydrogenase family)
MAIELTKNTGLPAWASGLEGRVALITGASRGIGRACALAFAAAGANVIAVARQQADLDALVTEANGRIEGWADDVTSDAFLGRVEALPALDILFTNAGMNRPLLIEDVDTATLDQMLALNVRAVYRAAQSAARVMIKAERGGSIIHMSSQMGHVGAARRTVYCMTKHAIEGLTKAMAVELAPHGIRVNSIAPTFIETDLTRPMFDDPAFRHWVLESIPMGRIGQPEDIVGAVLFLASPASSMITGDSLRIDGGWTAR